MRVIYWRKPGQPDDEAGLENFTVLEVIEENAGEGFIKVVAPEGNEFAVNGALILHEVNVYRSVALVGEDIAQRVWGKYHTGIKLHHTPNKDPDGKTILRVTTDQSTYYRKLMYDSVRDQWSYSEPPTNEWKDVPHES